MLCGMALGIGLFVVLPISKDYRADSQVLIIPDSRYGVDPYTAIRLAEQVGSNLSQIVETSDFSRKVLARVEGRVDLSEYLTASELERRKAWSKDIDASVTFGTGVMTVGTYHQDPQAAILLNQAVITTMLSDASEYIGSNVTLKIVNQPVASELPVRPHLLVVVLIAALFGALLAVIFFVK